MPEPYPDTAVDERFAQWASVRFDDVHRRVLDLLPPTPARVIDVGAGSGRDSQALALLGYDVLAVEPWAAMREAASKRHNHPSIVWLDDRLPGLDKVDGPNSVFDVLLVSAVWMHLDAPDREKAMRSLSRIASPGALLILTIRNPPDPQRAMWQVPLAEVRKQAHDCGFRSVRQFQSNGDALGRGDVSWDIYCAVKMCEVPGREA